MFVIMIVILYRMKYNLTGRVAQVWSTHNKLACMTQHVFERRQLAEVWSTHNNLACMTQQVRWRSRPSIPTYLTDGEGPLYGLPNKLQPCGSTVQPNKQIHRDEISTLR
jgi:hypothetical protein